MLSLHETKYQGANDKKRNFQKNKQQNISFT